jgi:RNA polymerase sigma factor (TIGR02999 family)
MNRKSEVTRLLGELAGGDASAFDQLIPLVYEDLRLIAHRHLRRHGAAITLNTTALVHEAYLRLVDRSRLEWKDRGHFLAVYSVVMRNLLVDIARKRRAVKRGGDRVRTPLDENTARVDYQADHVLAVDRALSRLSDLDERLARVVECRFFAGLTEEETASALGVTDRTVQRDWAKAKALLSEWIETN